MVFATTKCLTATASAMTTCVTVQATLASTGWPWRCIKGRSAEQGMLFPLGANGVQDIYGQRGGRMQTLPARLYHLEFMEGFVELAGDVGFVALNFG